MLAQIRDEPLARIYGQDLTEVVYIQTTALIARLRLGSLVDVERLVLPFVNGEKDSLAKLTASHLSGHLLFDELQRITSKGQYRERVLAAAARVEFSIYNEMSDGVFMGCPILARAGQIETAVEHYEQLEKLCLRSDGLWRHSPLCDAAWGRGNAFPALGMALTLESTPRLLRQYQRLLTTLAKHQTPNGLWRQVIDHPTAYEEFSATAMIGAAMRKGVRNGWLNRTTFQPIIDRAAKALAARTSTSGELVDVCESTGKQKTLQDYLNRKAIRGRDPRGGAMALYFITEP
ncbi:MAG: glycoside hydrolase family 88 protein [Acidobacteria bacterium]|nr:glycoside hydrolase family 88 protein [Acidobacteriota bacterium]